MMLTGMEEYGMNNQHNRTKTNNTLNTQIVKLSEQSQLTKNQRKLHTSSDSLRTLLAEMII